MGLLAKISSVFDRHPSKREVSAESTRGIGGAVARKDDAGWVGSYFTPIIARAGVQKSYAAFTEEVINTLPDNQVRNLIRRSSPIVAKALADYADAIASGFTYTADKTLGAHPDIPAQRLIQDFLDLLQREQGGLEHLIGEMARGMFSHGALFMELVIDTDGRTPIELKTLDPTTAVYRRNEDPVKGEFYELGQDIGFVSSDLRTTRGRAARANVVQRQFNRGSGAWNFVSLEGDPTVQYRPIQSEPNEPYGTPILDPAVFHVIMMAGFFASFREALTGHVWPNMLISIDKKKFKEHSGVSTNPQQLEEKLNALVKDIVTTVQKLKPGAALIQGDEVTIGGHLSGQNRSPLGSIKDIQDVLRRELIVAVQSQPILMGSNESIAETHAIEQMKAFGKLIRRSQKPINGGITEFFNLILQLNDYPRLADFRLNYENTAEYKDQARTYMDFRQGLLTASQDLREFTEALDTAKQSGYIDDATAQRMWDEGMEIRRQLNILPQEL